MHRGGVGAIADDRFVRFARSTTDFLIASRTVGTATNAAAVSGEYLAAASFLGVAGLVLKNGPDALWYPIGFTLGLLLMVFVAAPMRLSGAYTLPDFVEYRPRGRSTQRHCAGFIAGIGWMLLGPRLQGAGLTIAAVVPGLPARPGTLAAGLMVVVTVVFGGMRSITFVQAFQFWLKVAALAMPVVVLFAVVGPGINLMTERSRPDSSSRPRS
jgi:Na+(H+)/acetate symporter ActP